MTHTLCVGHTVSMAKYLPADRFGNPPEWMPENEDEDSETPVSVSVTGTLPAVFDGEDEEF